MHFHHSNQVKTSEWLFASWEKDEKKVLDTRVGALPWDPEWYSFEVYFPNVDHKWSDERRIRPSCGMRVRKFPLLFPAFLFILQYSVENQLCKSVSMKKLLFIKQVCRLKYSDEIDDFRMNPGKGRLEMLFAIDTSSLRERKLRVARLYQNRQKTLRQRAEVLNVDLEEMIDILLELGFSLGHDDLPQQLETAKQLAQEMRSVQS